MTTYLITGASRGIGRALMAGALARGDSVIATARNPENTNWPEGAEVHALDVQDQPAHRRLAEVLGTRTIDALICNAGIYLGRGRIGDAAFDTADWQATLMTNVAGPFFAVEAFLPHLARAKAPRIAIISSQMGSSARAGGGAYIYRASKAAATNLAVNLAKDLAPQGIAVAAYHPGWVRTDMGTSAAAIDVEESITGLLQQIDDLSMAESGRFLFYSGEEIPF
ncbi:MAG: SDR family oxidoreductase [Pseudomonadota bacterium]